MLKKDQKKKNVLKNGAELLEERLVTAFGRDNPMKMFSASQIQQAIASYEKRNPRQTYPPSGWGWKWRKGILDDHRMVFIKYKHDNHGTSKDELEGAFRDIVVSSMMSSHRNVLKLLGCCLEFAAPALVYEDAEKGFLNSTGGLDEDGSVLSWKNRLKIAMEIASAVAYLHTAFPTRIIHRDINPANIMVNQDYAAKLTDFSLSTPIPEGESPEADVVGNIGFLYPDYARHRLLNEKIDVYSFGVLLLVFLTGKSAIRFSTGKTAPEDIGRASLPEYVERMIKKGKFREVVDPAILGNVAGTESELHPQLQAFVELAQSCVKSTPESMIQVAKELLRIERSIPPP